jgi:hypothetical protein
MNRAVAAAVAIAREHGVRVALDDAIVLKDGANVVVHLRPAPVVARIASMTALVRRDPAAYLARDVAVARHAFARGAPVVPPSNDLPPGPHELDGRVVTFWHYVEHESGHEAGPAELGPLLRELHAALVDYDGVALPYLGPVLGEFDGVVDALVRAGAIPHAQAERWREELVAVEVALPAPGAAGEQALHGDAHRRNVLRTASGLLWVDFEDACHGSVAWDLACLGRRSGPAAIAAYGDERPSDAELAPFLAARALQSAVWEAVFAARDAGVLVPGH